MLFNSFEFLVFLPVVFLCYWAVSRRRCWQNTLLIAASYLFYGWWNVECLALIFGTTVLCFVAGIMIGRARGRAARRWINGVNIVVNIGVLCYFKYFNFFADNLLALFSQFGFQLDWVTMQVLLPVGISFYTFQAISYPIDVYRGNISPCRDFGAFMAFISFFPQLVAGPIERSTSLLPQFYKRRRFDADQASSGVRQALWGLFKKMVVADNCAYIANSIFGDAATESGASLLLGALFFTFQIYGDFSGYSDIAIGVARLFGIRLTRNFHYPYFSRSVAEFWRRWHISLNTWFIDYIYIPLGGSRGSRWATVRNTFVVFLTSGLWHGADWTFVAWGAYFAVLLTPGILLGRRVRPGSLEGRLSPREYASMALTFALVVLGWIIFRADNIAHLTTILGRMFSSDFMVGPLLSAQVGRMRYVYTAAFIIIMQAVDWSQRGRDYGLQVVEHRQALLRWSAYLLIMAVIMVFAGSQEKFIYFQF